MERFIVHQFKLVDAQATLELGKQFGRSLPPNSVILLQGDLGTGKTTLVQGIGATIGIGDPIVSPTFTLINEYTQGRLPLYHFDLYRLESSEIVALSPEMYWEGREVDPGITAIEWADRLPYLPPAYLEVRLQHTPRGERWVDLKQVGLEDWDFCLPGSPFPPA